MIDPETGTEYRRLTRFDGRWCKHVYTDVSPWKPDGTAIAFAVGRDDTKEPAELCVASPDGQIAWPFARDGWFSRHAGCFQTWAPDGMGLYYWSRSGRQSSVFLDFRMMRRRIIGPLFQSLSPCGRHLLYRELGQLPIYQVFSGNDLCLMESNGTGHRVLVSADTLKAVSQAVKPTPLAFTNSRFSPDGSKVLFANSWGETFVAVPRCHFCGSVEILPLGEMGHCSWFPDSERIVYMTADGLNIVHFDGSYRILLTADRNVYGSPGAHPVVSPDGRRIATESYVPGAFALHLVDARTGEGGKFLNVGSTYGAKKPEGTHMHPTWSPDGSQIIYDSDETGTCQVYVAEVPVEAPADGSPAVLKARAFPAADCVGDFHADSPNTAYVYFSGPNPPTLIPFGSKPPDVVVP